MKSLMKLGLLIPCIAFAASCNNQTKYRAHIAYDVFECSKEKGDTYWAMQYNVQKRDGKDRKLTTSNFYAKNGETKVTPECFLVNVNLDNKTYGSTTTEVTAATDKLGGIFVAFKYKLGEKPGDKYYFGDVVMPTEDKDPVEVTIK